jgi:hypothetical protein
MYINDPKIDQGNLLGGARAEADSLMLDNAFIATHDFQALVNTKDFNFVVGRRGTGKSALFFKVSEYFTKNKMGYVFRKTPTEYDAIELQSVIKNISTEYRPIRAITRVAWRASILIGILNNIIGHYKIHRCDNYDVLRELNTLYESLIGYDCFKKTTEIIKKYSSKCSSPDELPSSIAYALNIEKLHDLIANALSDLNIIAYFFFDGLDEGWVPNELATALVGGLAACAADFSENQRGINIVLFVRDNIYRSLSYFDRDFSRHIEGNTLRLNWDDSSLLHLISNRLRIALGLKNIESDVKAWNRFAYSDLKNREGFDYCLKYTLYRPRDLIVLLNTAYIQTNRSGRKELIKDDIEISSKQISKNRLNDLQKEYDMVFPGLPLFIDIFKGKEAFREYGVIVNELKAFIDNVEYKEVGNSDFAILETGEDAFFALYSVGFLGMENPVTKNLRFCHDGSSADIDATKTDQRVCIHPCYWKALDIKSELIEENIIIELYDDSKTTSTEEITDIRTKKIGQLLSSLPQMPEGQSAANEFEEWVFRTVQILFAGHLSNPEFKPNSDAIQRRDIVATNMAPGGFWRRVREDYNSREVVIEVKNYTKLKNEDFRQALSYSGEFYGQFIVIVNRNQNEGLSTTEKGWVQEIWHQHKVIIFVIPASILSRCISKLRSRKRFDYTDNQLNKRLDIFLRSYLSLRHPRKGTSKGK